MKILCMCTFNNSHIFGLQTVLRSHRWARNFKNVAPQKQNAICKPRAQYAKCNCAFKLFKGHCTATINAKNANFHKNIFKAQLFKLKCLIPSKFLIFTGFQPLIFELPSTGLNHYVIRAQLTKNSRIESTHKSCD
jgi:hypothetical protein